MFGGEKMNDLFKIIIGAIFAILLIGGAMIIFSQPSQDDVTNANANPIQEQIDNLNSGESVEVTNPQNNVTYTINASSSSNNSNSASGQNSVNSNQYSNNGVTGGELGQNYQEGEGSYYQINYENGDFRQYDTKTGELVGSSFDDDQEKLGVVNGSLE